MVQLLNSPGRLPWLPGFLIVLSVGASSAAQEFTVPPDDLPRIAIGGADVSFTPWGAFVVSKKGVNLMDGGLSFATHGWKRWGQQIRDSDRLEPRALSPDKRTLTFHSMLMDFKHNSVALEFRQTVRVVGQALDFGYEITSIEPTKLDQLGLVFHVPRRRFEKKLLETFPGFNMLFLPDKVPANPQLLAGVCRTMAFGRDEQEEIVLTLSDPVRCTAQDERAWNVDTYAAHFDFAPRMKPGAGAGFKFGFRLGFEVFPSALRVPLGEGELAVFEDGTFLVERGVDILLQGGLQAGEPPKVTTQFALGRRKRIETGAVIAFEGELPTSAGQKPLVCKQTVQRVEGKPGAAEVRYAVQAADASHLQNLMLGLYAPTKLFSDEAVTFQRDETTPASPAGPGENHAALCALADPRGSTLKLSFPQPATWFYGKKPFYGPAAVELLCAPFRVEEREGGPCAVAVVQIQLTGKP
ncbi:MAG: hypothetical protein FJ279_04820 [Planctomycetes bacterium]|nr:hypothetical protein [Planctomycetota bacterium]